MVGRDLEANLKTTKKQFEEFKTRYMYWAGQYGIDHDWEISFELEKEYPTQMDCDARVNMQLVPRIATVKVSSDLTRENVDYLAFHEATELFLGRFRILAEHRHLGPHDVDEEVHGLIAGLDKALRRTK